MAPFPTPQPLTSMYYGRHPAAYAVELLVIAGIYFCLTKIDEALGAPYTFIPISLAPGFGLGALLVRGMGVWPAIFAGAFAACAPDLIARGGLLNWATTLFIAGGNALEAIVSGYLMNTWAHGHTSFETPGGTARFAIISTGPGAMIGACLGTFALWLLGSVGGDAFASVWIAWWLRDASGLLVVASSIVLFAPEKFRFWEWETLLPEGNWFSIAAVAITGIIGLIAFSPLLELPVNRGALGLIAVWPLLWTALYCGPRATAAGMLMLSACAVWGAGPGYGGFEAFVDESFLISTIALISGAVLSLTLHAEVAKRERDKDVLRSREQNLRTLLSHADVGLAQIDTSGTFKLVNSRYCEIFRTSVPRLLSSQIDKLIDPNDHYQMRGLLDQAVNTGEAFSIESKTRLTDDTHLWIRTNVVPMSDQGGAVRYLVAVADDVTARREAEENLISEHQKALKTLDERAASLNKTREVLDVEMGKRKLVEEALKREIAKRRQAQEALMQNEWRFRTVIQGVTDYAIFMLDRDGCVTNWNTGAQRMHQYANAEILGRHFSLFFSEDEQQGGEPARALQVAGYEGKYVIQGWRTRRDDSKFWASVVIVAVRDDAGELIGYVHITRDDTERHRAEASLDRAHEQLAQSQKMEALGQLTGSIAHDFNNLLMIVSGHAQLLRRRLTDPKHLQAIDAVNSAANRGESLTRQLLAFSRRQPLNPVVTDLKERVEAVREMLIGSLRGNVHLKCDIAPEIWPVEVDIAELELALVNIAVNARDAMPGGGVITLSAQNVTLQKADGVDQLEGDFVVLAMTDTGVGIPADVLPRIFEPFFTTKALGKGTGLGLAQVYGFSHQSGGTVIATSKVGSGTAISMYLPRKHATIVRAPETIAPEPNTAGDGTVLVVEDNPEVAEVSASLLEQLGYRVLRANDARDALDRLQRGYEVALVFSDIVMPGSMNGIALAQEIKNRYPHIPVLLTSGYSDVVQIAASQVRVLRKPFQLEALQKSIREALEHAHSAEHEVRVLPFPSRRHRDTGVVAS